MKKIFVILLAFILMFTLLAACGSNNEAAEPEAQETGITEEMALEGITNYCHIEYDWSAAEENPDIMSIEMGEATDTEYQVIFHSYTGSVVNFYVDKTTGTTRIEEYVPALDTTEEAGTIELKDYLG